MGVVGYRAPSVRYPLDFWHWEKRSGNPEDFFKKSGALENTSELNADQDHVNNFSDGGEDQFDREFFDLSSICTSAIAGSFSSRGKISEVHVVTTDSTGLCFHGCLLIVSML